MTRGQLIKALSDASAAGGCAPAPQAQQEQAVRLALMTYERDKLARQVDALEFQRTRIPKAPHPDTRTVVQQMVDALKNANNSGPYPLFTEAIAAGQKLLEVLP